MTPDEASNVLRECREYVDFSEEDQTVRLDGNFTLEELEALMIEMKQIKVNKNGS